MSTVAEYQYEVPAVVSGKKIFKLPSKRGKMNSKALAFHCRPGPGRRSGSGQGQADSKKRSLADFQKGSFRQCQHRQRRQAVPGAQAEERARSGRGILSVRGRGQERRPVPGDRPQRRGLQDQRAPAKREMVFKGEQLDVYALLVAGNGDVIAGTSPNGRVFRIAKDNKVSELFNPDEKFIWDLAEDKQGNIICALGNTGAVYSIGKTGDSGEPFHGRGFAHHQPARHPGQCHPGRQRRPRHPLRDQKPQGQGSCSIPPWKRSRASPADDEGNVYFRRGQERS